MYGLSGGDIKTICPFQDPPGSLLVGTKEGKIFFSDNAGEQWQAAQLPLLPPGNVIEIIIPGFKKGEFFAGIRHEEGYGLIFRSEDAGRTWIVIETKPALPPIRALALVSTATPLLLAGTTTGLWASSDQGQNWQQSFVPASSPSVASLLVDPIEPQRVYLGTWRRAFRSDDGAKTFQPIWSGMVEDSHVFSFASSPNKNQTVYASTCGWVYRSNHYGEAWSIRKAGLSDRRIHAVATSSLDPKTLFAATPSGLFVSADEGNTWKKGSIMGMVINTLSVDPISGAVYLGLEGQGLMKSADNGLNFHPINQGLFSNSVQNIIAQGPTVFSVVSYGDNAGRIYYGPEHDPLQHFVALHNGFGKITSVQPLHQTEPAFLIGTYKGLFHVKNAVVTQRDPEHIIGPVRRIAIHPRQPELLFSTTGKGLFFSDDQGETWLERSPEQYHGECFDLIFDLLQPDTVYLASLIGVFKSDDLGLHWQYASFQLPKMKISVLIQDPHQPSTLLAMTPKGLYRSQDAAQTWESYICYDLPEHLSFVIYDPDRAGVLYANDLKNGGLYQTTNSGRTWTNLPAYKKLRFLDACFGSTTSANPQPVHPLFLGTFGSGLLRVGHYSNTSSSDNELFSGYNPAGQVVEESIPSLSTSGGFTPFLSPFIADRGEEFPELSTLQQNVAPG